MSMVLIIWSEKAIPCKYQGNDTFTNFTYEVLCFIFGFTNHLVLITWFNMLEEAAYCLGALTLGLGLDVLPRLNG